MCKIKSEVFRGERIRNGRRKKTISLGNFFTKCLWAAGMVVNGGSLMERISGLKMDHLPCPPAPL